MKHQGKGRLARQMGGKGAFAEVVLQLEPSKKLSISFDECDASDRHSDGEIHYAVAVSFGIRFALEKLTFTERRLHSYDVRVLCIHTMVVDSTESFVAYAAAKAVYAALGRTDEPIEFDIERRAIILARS